MIKTTLLSTLRLFRILVAVGSMGLAALVFLDLGRSIVSSPYHSFGVSIFIPSVVAVALLLPGSGLAFMTLLYRNDRWSLIRDAILLVITPALTLVGALMYWSLAYG